jgi:hypothetical protein
MLNSKVDFDSSWLFIISNMPCPHGKQYPSYCNDCGGTKKCPHNKRKCRCKECGGTSICTHGRIKYGCTECKGAGVCEHNRVRSECKCCGGSRNCIHGVRKTLCPTCDGSNLCPHKKRKYNCIDCGGGAYCEHNRNKSSCKECKGSAICTHNKFKKNCLICNGSNYCKHNKTKKLCRECGGSAYCEHDKVKRICKVCKGADICYHNKRKEYCKECNGSACCKSQWCTTIPSNKKYDGYCLLCYIHLFPEKPILRNYKTKERAVTNFITTTFTEETWVVDKKIADGCSFKRPDLLCDLGYQVIIIEVDETQHSTYDCSCENKRIMELSRDVDHRPIIFIRFNPDKYISSDGVVHRTCWAVNKYGTYSILKREEWISRLNTLRDTILYWITNSTEKTVEMVHLYYNEL